MIPEIPGEGTPEIHPFTKMELAGSAKNKHKVLRLRLIFALGAQRSILAQDDNDDNAVVTLDDNAIG